MPDASFLSKAQSASVSCTAVSGAGRAWIELRVCSPSYIWKVTTVEVVERV